MKPFLLPYRYKNPGWLLLIPSLLAGLVYILLGNEFPLDSRIKVFGYFGDAFMGSQHQGTGFSIAQIELFPNLISILFLIGGMLVVFSKEKTEDEFIHQIRLNAFQFSVFINYLLLLGCFFIIHGFPFLNIMMYNMFTVIIIYLLRFHYLLFKNSMSNYEEQN
jgi:hypothetical protein